jgi:AraC-like DNA-binding protein
LAEIAVDVDRALARRTERGGPAGLDARVVARGEGWMVRDVVCTSGPRDRSYEECHSQVSIAIVTAGSFQYRAGGTTKSREIMTPGSVLLGSAGQYFECGHDHGAGDRCLSFQYTPDYFERLTAGAGARGAGPRFRSLRLPPLRELSAVIAQACATLLAGSDEVAWEELSVRLAVRAAQLDGARAPATAHTSPAAEARVIRTVRRMERHPDAPQTLGALSREARLSPFHFLRTFEQVTGVTPHQYIRRARLREAATRLLLDQSKVLDIAFDSGFGDVSNFNRAFRAEFGISPRAYRRSRA